MNSLLVISFLNELELIFPLDYYYSFYAVSVFAI